MPHKTQTTATGAPFVKFAAIGDTFVGAFVGGKNRQQRDWKTGEPKWKDDGKPLLEHLMHFIAMPGTTAGKGRLDDLEPIEPGEHVRYAVRGWGWGQLIEACKKLPPFDEYDVKAGETVSTDVYTFTVVGYSATTENAAGARKAGFTVEDGRIIMRTADEHEKWVLNQIRHKGNSNAAMDFELTVRRFDPATEQEWADAADAAWETKPWEQAAEAAPNSSAPPPADPTDPGPADDPDYDDEEPF
jgi:hypothetical protein